MRVGIVFVLMLMLMLVPGMAAAQSTGTMTKRELRTQPPATTDRQLRNQLWSIFRKEDRRTKKPPRAALGDVWLETKPYATGVDGLCRFDVVRLHFAPDPPDRDLTGQTPSRAYGIDSEARYRFVRQARDEGYRADPWQAECVTLDTAKLQFFTAPDVETADAGYAALRAVSAQLGKRSLKVTSCDRFPAETDSCEAIILGTAKDDPDSIDRCDAPALARCFTIDLDGMEREVRIVRVAYPGYRDAQGEEVPVGTILSLGMTSRIVVSDALID